MAQFEIKENPIYNGDMTKIETSTPVHASVINKMFGQLLENDAHLIKEKSDKVHGHVIHDINNILFEIRDNPSASVGKYTRIMESVLINKANSGAYARYQVQFDYSDYFEIDIAIQQDKLLTEEMPKIYVSSYNCPNWVGVYVTVQSDPDWQLYDIDLYLKIEKQFNKMILRELLQNGNTSVLTHYGAYKVIDRLEDRQNLVKIIEAVKNTLLTEENRTKLEGVETNANNYTHPATHSPNIITQDTNNRFVTDAEKTAWNEKANASHTHSKQDVGLGNVDNTADANKSVNYANGAGNSNTTNGQVLAIQSNAPSQMGLWVW